MRNTEEPQGIPLTQLCIRDAFMTGITSDWVISTIEDNMATPRDPRSIRAWRESSKHGQEEKSQNMINVQLAQEKSHFERRSSNISNLGENVAHAQQSVSQEEEEIQNSNFEDESSKLKPLGNFNMSYKETRRLELWNN